ncbi:MAG: Alpha amylase, N-terminal ig-like domain, partial [Clostridia bacterium]|nr:Alpha amylase, N-terminal ig-like domain [Clostridia bacterium]
MKNVTATHYETREYIYPIDRNTLSVKIKCKADGEYSVNIVYWNRFKEEKKECELESFCINGPSDYYSIMLAFEESAKYLRYYFVIKSHEEIIYYSPYGLTSDIPMKYFEYQSTNVN